MTQSAKAVVAKPPSSVTPVLESIYESAKDDDRIGFGAALVKVGNDHGAWSAPWSLDRQGAHIASTP